MRSAIRFLLIGLFLATLTFLLQGHVSAQVVTNQNLNLQVNADVQPGLHTYTQGLFLEMIDAGICQIWGIDPLNQKNHLCLGYDSSTGKIGYVQSAGAISFMGSMIGSLYHPPVPMGQYIADVRSHFGVTKTYAQVQGIGFFGLSPLITIWSAIRNIVYLLFVVVFILVGFGIMFRFKIDPRTVMSIENQIPKLVVALLLVTFSFAIAGLLVDAMWVLIYFIINTMVGAFPNLDLGGITSGGLLGHNPFEITNNLPGGILGIVSHSAGAVKDVIGSLFNTNDDIGGFIAHIITGLIGALAGLACPGPLALICVPALGLGAGIAGPGPVLGLIAGVLGFLVIGVAVILALFRLWFALISAYLFILLDVVLAPLHILFGVFPGSKIGFGSWIRGMLGNLLAFPATVFLLMFAAIMTNANVNTTNMFYPPLIGNPGSSNNNAFTSLIGLGVLLICPQIVQMTRNLVKAPEGKTAAGIGQVFGTAAGNVFGFGKGIAQTTQSSEEIIIKKVDPKTGQIQYGHRGLPRAILGRFSGRG